LLNGNKIEDSVLYIIELPKLRGRQKSIIVTGTP